MLKRILIFSCSLIAFSAAASEKTVQISGKQMHELILSNESLVRTIIYQMDLYFKQADEETKKAIRTKAFKSAKKAVYKELSKIPHADDLETIIEACGCTAAARKIRKEYNRTEYIKRGTQEVIEAAYKKYPDSDQE